MLAAAAIVTHLIAMMDGVVLWTRRVDRNVLIAHGYVARVVVAVDVVLTVALVSVVVVVVVVVLWAL